MFFHKSNKNFKKLFEEFKKYTIPIFYVSDLNRIKKFNEIKSNFELLESKYFLLKKIFELNKDIFKIPSTNLNLKCAKEDNIIFKHLDFNKCVDYNYLLNNNQIFKNIKEYQRHNNIYTKHSTNLFLKIINNKSYGNDNFNYYSPYLMNDLININSNQNLFLIELKNNNFRNIKLDIDKIFIEEINIINIKNKKYVEITVPKNINHNLDKEDIIYIYNRIPNLKDFKKLQNVIGKFNKNIFYIKNIDNQNIGNQNIDIQNNFSIGDFISINDNLYKIIKFTKKGYIFCLNSDINESNI